MTHDLRPIQGNKGKAWKVGGILPQAFHQVVFIPIAVLCLFKGGIDHLADGFKVLGGFGPDEKIHNEIPPGKVDFAALQAS